MSFSPRTAQFCRYLMSACAAASLIGAAAANAAGGSSSGGSGKSAAKAAGQPVKVPDSSRNIIKTPATAPRIKLQPIEPAPHASQMPTTAEAVPHASQMPTTAEAVPHYLGKSIAQLLKKDLPPYKGVGDGPRGGVLSKEKTHSGPTAVPRQIEPDAPPPYRSIIRKKPKGEMAI